MNHTTTLRTKSARTAALLLTAAMLATSCSSSDGTTAAVEPAPEQAAPDLAYADDSGIVVNDPLLAGQWSVQAANLDSAWTEASGTGATIAIIDSGVDLDHPDLQAQLVPGWDFVDSDDVPDDENGHGTHVAGIAAATSNAVGIAGAAPEASIMPIRVLDASGSGTDDMIADGIIWAVDHGADIINLSLGESGLSSRLTKGGSVNRAIRYASENDVVVIAASGNEGTAGQQYRLGVNVLVVNASDSNGELASFSNVGDVRSITAPGVDILSTSPIDPSTLWPEGTDGYSSLDGTSMATPLVSGIAALLISDGVPADQVIDRLTAAAANPGNDPLLGAGIVDAGAALGVDAVDQPAPETTVPAEVVEEPTTTEAPAQVEEPTTEAPATTAPPTTAAPVTEAPVTAPPATVPTLPALPTAGTGSLTLVVTAPVSYSATVPADVSCGVTGVRYNASVASTDLGHGYTASANVVVAPFNGAGTYAAAGMVQMSTPSGDFPVPLVGSATIDADYGGNVGYSIDGFSAYIAWECNK